MRDIKVYSADTYDLDINIVDGQPAFLDTESQTPDQRAGLAAFIALGTVPGKLTTGVDWGALYTKDASYVDISNQISKQIQNYVSADIPTTSYLPLIIPDNEKVALRLVRT